MNTPSKRSVLHTRTIYESPNLLADLEPTLLGADLGKPGVNPSTGTTQMRLKKGVCATECLAGATGDDAEMQTLTTTQPTDLLVALPNAELVAFTPEMSGWYAELLVDAHSERAIRDFNEACKTHLSTMIDDGHKRVHIEPCVEPLPGQGRNGMFTAKIYAKVSEWGRRLMHSHFVEADGGKLLGSPGAMVTDVYERSPAGRCAATVHLMGCWHDKTKTGVHLYLDRVELLPEPPAALVSEVRADPVPSPTSLADSRHGPQTSGCVNHEHGRRRNGLARLTVPRGGPDGRGPVHLPRERAPPRQLLVRGHPGDAVADDCLEQGEVRRQPNAQHVLVHVVRHAALGLRLL